MATAAAAAPAAPPSKGKGKLFLILGIVFVLLGGAGGAWYFLGKKAGAGEHVEDAKSAPKKAVYAPLERFTVNLHDATHERYMQADLTLEVADTKVADAIKAQMPTIRNRILLLLSSKEANELLTREGKEKLANEICEEVRKNVEGSSPTKGVEQVLFSHFVIQ